MTDETSRDDGRHEIADPAGQRGRVHTAPPSDDAEGDGEPRGHGPHSTRLLPLCVAALGVVYGDIGTSPLYALRETFAEERGLAVSPENVIGVLSLILWSLIFVIAIKYLAFVLRADNDGEGGILALAALVLPGEGRLTRRGQAVVALGLFGAALLYGDGMITPAISVLSAIEGLEVATPFFRPYVIPITIVILLGIFAIQQRGTERVGRLFGPITFVWFLVLAALAVPHILRTPEVFAALNPLHGLGFFANNGWRGFTALGSIYLVVTGGEALYADMGHFGPLPIRITWFAIVMPGLVLNYFGQGALVLATPEAVHNPFYRMAPAWALFPLVGLAALATIIASQAVISGAFSLTMQAVRMGYSPRMEIRHTSPTEAGQIYIPAVNWVLMVACIGLVLAFRSSGNLAAAYGIAVSTTMVITTLLFYLVLRQRWGWSAPLALALCGAFLVVDLAFFGANVLKFADGGWFPLLIAALVFTLMATWKRGREILYERIQERTLPLHDALESIERDPPHRVPGTAVYLYSNPSGTPPALQRNLEFNRVLHEHNVILTLQTEDVPRVPEERRLSTEAIAPGLWRAVARFGFMETPYVPGILRSIDAPGVDFAEATYLLGRETMRATPRPGMALWRERLFIRMSRNARSASVYFGLPPDRVVEVGAQVEL